MAFLFFSKEKIKHTKKNKTTKQQQQNKQKTPFCMLANTPLFLVTFCFFQVALFYFCKAVFRWKHYKKTVFSAEHSFRYHR